MSAGPSFAGRVAVVTAAGSGIGQATAVLLAELGAEVVAVDVDAERLASSRRLAPERLVPLQADVTDAAAVARVAAEVRARFGAIQVLANVVGGGSRGKRLHELSRGEWDRILDYNLGTVFEVSRAFIPLLIQGGGGAIVNVSSGAALRAVKENSAYSAAKGAVISLTKAMALDYAADGIRVNCVAPGPVATALMRRRSPEDVARIAQVTMQLRIGQPRELASVIAFLASDGASFMTGELVEVNGGIRLGI
jgi:NAD(P)-dependent dehydrogenase (short-subunit alcohol dehydrogenase family)